MKLKKNKLSPNDCINNKFYDKYYIFITLAPVSDFGTYIGFLFSVQDELQKAK